MRVVSLVPSLTETLLEAGADVVGRTRFCVHPKDKVQHIPRVGGTKDWNLEKIRSLRPDLLVLDREENPKFMSEGHEIPWVATHVRSLSDMPETLALLNKALQLPSLLDLRERWERVMMGPQAPSSLEPSWDSFPGLLDWIQKPADEVREIVYMIWKDPWMGISSDTFIGSVLAHLGYKAYLKTYPVKYPELKLESFDPKTTLFLFSSEPYPFSRKLALLRELNVPSALVNGEFFSWFGVRSLRFLEECKKYRS